jgi:Amt family ammonium transporter
MITWALVGYSFAFADGNAIIGGLDHVGLSGVAFEPRDGQTIPHLLFCAYQLMFAIITPALISGAFAERVRFGAYALFTLLWTTIVYDPLAHWVWGPGGWLATRGALDFAGGTVVHLSSGISALVFAVVLGRRLGYPRQKMLPHNLTMTMLGAGLLSFGWFGFNAGSALSSGGLAALALVNTQIAAGAGALAWASIEWVRHKKPSALGVASGLVAGLVAITPAAGFCGPMAALGIGLAAGLVCYLGVLIKHRFSYDDALDAFGVHGLGGALGAVLTGVVASKAWNPAGQDGLAFGGVALFLENLLSVVVAGVYAAVASFVLLKLVDRVVGLRPDPEIEHEGLDISLHGEEAYATAGVSMRPVFEREHDGEREPAVVMASDAGRAG